MNETGYRQGYYIGLFGRFLWLFFIYSLVHTMIIYTFDVNWLSYWVLAIVFSFLINTSMPMGNTYAFIRHGLILFCLLMFHVYISYHFTHWVYSFFAPELIWKLLFIISIPFGIASSFGRYGNGTYSKNIESISNFILIIFMILAFVFYWWRGGVVYLSFRIIFMMVELLIANYILNHFRQVEEAKYSIES